MGDHHEDLRSCLVCHRSGVDGIPLAGEFVCEDCERRIVECESTDPDYDELLQGVKSLWRLYGEVEKRKENREREAAGS